jgi:hypothetical protein
MFEGEQLMSTYTVSIEQTMETMTTNHASISNKQLWAARILSGLPTLFLLMDGGMKLFKPAVVVEATLQVGYPESATGYLGGAVATYVRVSGPFFNTIFPVFISALLWGGLWLRDRRLRELLPLREQ